MKFSLPDASGHFQRWAASTRKIVSEPSLRRLTFGCIWAFGTALIGIWLRVLVGDIKNPDLAAIIQYLALVAGLVASILLACAFWLMDAASCGVALIRTTTDSNRRIGAAISGMADAIENLDECHNIIQTKPFGRVLALRDFEYSDLIEGDDYYQSNLGRNYCILSTAIVDRAEELLTSSVYMKFFVDLTQPNGGYFRLLIARDPKSLEGLLAYLAVSEKLKYMTTLLPLDHWQRVIIPLISRDVTNGSVRDEVIGLFERNLELAIKGGDLRTPPVSLNGRRVNSVRYAGRIEKRDEHKTPRESTITKFTELVPDDTEHISTEAVVIYIKLMNAFRKWQPLSGCNQEQIEKVLRGVFKAELRDEVTRALAKK